MFFCYNSCFLFKSNSKGFFCLEWVKNVNMNVNSNNIFILCFYYKSKK